MILGGRHDHVNKPERGAAISKTVIYWHASQPNELIGQNEAEIAEELKMRVNWLALQCQYCLKRNRGLGVRALVNQNVRGPDTQRRMRPRMPL
jgi:hypothetical protein